MTRPTVAQAEGWHPDALRRLADDWDEAAHYLRTHVDAVVSEVKASRDFWTGSAADSAHEWAGTMVAVADAVARALVSAAVAARDGADEIAEAQADVVGRVAGARTEGFVVGDDGHRALNRRRCSSRSAAATRAWRTTCWRCGPPS